jgi:diguanylate cyclase (GGDEF)-like protein
MSKSAFTRMTVFLVLLLAAYASAVVFQIDVWRYILSPINALASAGILFYTNVAVKRRTSSVIIIWCFFFACLAWTAGNISWGILTYLNKDTAPSETVYFLTNVFFFAVAVLFCVRQYQKWNTIRLVLDTLAVCASALFVIWIVFLHKDASVFQAMTRDGFTATASIFMDVAVIIQIFLWFFSVRRGTIHPYLYIVAAGIFLYCAVDLLYYYLHYFGLYVSSSLMDCAYVLPFSVVAFGLLVNAHYYRGDFDAMAFDNIGKKNKWVFLLLFPVLIVLLGDTNGADILILLGIDAAYMLLSNYVNLAVENERLLLMERDQNQILEKRVEEQLRELAVLANQDTVTKLYNRRYFYECLDKFIKALQGDEIAAVLQFDVDRFKTINDSYGHDVGDKVIIELSDRLLEWNNKTAVLARLGGDEFALLYMGHYSCSELAEYCKQLVEICSAPIFVEQQVLYLTISIGIAASPRDAADAVTLMKYADIAMYRAKADGFNKFVFFSPMFKENIRRKNEIEALLRKADLEKDFELVYQPQFELPDKRLIGAEALIRWKSAEHGYIPPSVFVPVAEEIDFINKIGKWVLFHAIDQVMTWNTRYDIPIKMGINISPKQLAEDDFFANLNAYIKEHGVNTAWIDAEITENLMIEDSAKVKPVFDLLEKIGISVSIDDFGSGYSSLGYLNKYHYNRIKIDKSLIDNLEGPGGSGLEVVKAIISMAKAVGKLTIAEGVETQEQYELLKKLGCRQVQGYLLGKPMPAEAFEKKFLKKLKQA